MFPTRYVSHFAFVCSSQLAQLASILRHHDVIDCPVSRRTSVRAVSVRIFDCHLKASFPPSIRHLIMGVSAEQLALAEVSGPCTDFRTPPKPLANRCRSVVLQCLLRPVPNLLLARVDRELPSDVPTNCCILFCSRSRWRRASSKHGTWTTRQRISGRSTGAQSLMIPQSSRPSATFCCRVWPRPGAGSRSLSAQARAQCASACGCAAEAGRSVVEA